MDTTHKARAFKTDEEQKVICAAGAKMPDDRRDNWDDLDLSLIVMIWRSGGRGITKRCVKGEATTLPA